MDREQLAQQRDRLLSEIATEARGTRNYTGRDRFADNVISALAAVPREAFINPNDVAHAYSNRPLPIGYGQTISQPFIVTLMTDLLDITPGDRVLEIGAGCGYQAAVLAQLAVHVYAIEVIPDLTKVTRQRLATLGYENISVRQGDGRKGWPEEAPFDAIIVSAVAKELPPMLTEQLAVGGRLVAPVGAVRGDQRLIRGTKDLGGSFQSRALLPVAFVPLV